MTDERLTSDAPTGGVPRRVDLARSLGELVREMATESDRLAHRFAQHHDLHATDFRALTLIHSAERKGTPLTPSRLAARLSLSSGAVTYLVERLVASGHVVRDSDPSDRRRVILRYAEHGHETATSYFRPLGAHMAGALDAFDDDQLAVARDVLTAMHGAMTTYDAEPTA